MNKPTKDYFKNSNQYGSLHIKKHFPEFYEWLLDKYKDYPQDKFPAYLYMYFNDLDCSPTCPVCGKLTPFLSYDRGFQKYCSLKCSNNDPEVIKKKEQTSLKKYGTTKPQQTDIVKQKSRETSLRLYGGQGNESKFIQKKQNQTMIEKYGVKCFSQNKQLLEKSKQTKLERYGNPWYTNIEKVYQTNIKRHGGIGMGSEDIRKKICNTKIENYDDPYYSNREKSKQTCLKRYGVECYTESEQMIDYITQLGREKSKQSHPEIIEFVDADKRIYKCPHPECNKCIERNFISDKYLYNNRIKSHSEVCTRLNEPGKGESSLEGFIKNILDENNITYVERSRKILDGLELDIYIPSHNIAIECNGVLFHSSDGLILNTPFKPKSPKYHIDKYKKCTEKGIQLLTVWEDQIINTPEIVKSLVLSKLGIFNQRIYARNCELKEIKECSKFLKENHIQGSTNSSIKLGLFYKGELVSVMTFSKPSRLSGSKKVDKCRWVLSRFCTKLNTQAIGAAGKLLKYFIKTYNPTIIDSFASNDISNGKLYEKLGFKQNGPITEAYWYIGDHNMIRYHRTSFTKLRLKELGFETGGLTERQIMNQLPFHKIYDSGHTKYTLNLC